MEKRGPQSKKEGTLWRLNELKPVSSSHKASWDLSMLMCTVIIKTKDIRPQNPFCRTNLLPTEQTWEMLFLFWFCFFKEVHEDNEGGKPSQSDLKLCTPMWKQHITCTLPGHLLSWLCAVSRRAARPPPSLTRPAHEEGIHLQGAPTRYIFGNSTPSVWKFQRIFICWIPYQMLSTKKLWSFLQLRVTHKILVHKEFSFLKMSIGTIICL